LSRPGTRYRKGEIITAHLDLAHPRALPAPRRSRTSSRPDGSWIVSGPKPQPDGTLVKALARAWRWQKLLNEGVLSSVTEIAEAEGIEGAAGGTGTKSSGDRRVPLDRL